MNNVINDLYEVILSRKAFGEEGSYTAYLFREGLDKILKKCGEECSEVIIAAKSLQAAEGDGSARDGGAVARKERDDLAGEVGDLIYHLLVLLAERGVSLEDVVAVLAERSGKTGNLKKMKTVDKNS